ncbi:hypothetical protein T492DRAFT_160502 [Pavlovales sp. CCMP2436]|nr:hypothetical protein T492DRAFT_160502 [Pavlovales sp. CCMP2436]
MDLPLLQSLDSTTSLPTHVVVLWIMMYRAFEYYNTARSKFQVGFIRAVPNSRLHGAGSDDPTLTSNYPPPPTHTRTLPPTAGRGEGSSNFFGEGGEWGGGGGVREQGGFGDSDSEVTHNRITKWSIRRTTSNNSNSHNHHHKHNHHHIMGIVLVLILTLTLMIPILILIGGGGGRLVRRVCRHGGYGEFFFFFFRMPTHWQPPAASWRCADAVTRFLRCTCHALSGSSVTGQSWSLGKTDRPLSLDLSF